MVINYVRVIRVTILIENFGSPSTFPSHLFRSSHCHSSRSSDDITLARRKRAWSVTSSPVCIEYWHNYASMRPCLHLWNGWKCCLLKISGRHTPPRVPARLPHLGDSLSARRRPAHLECIKNAPLTHWHGCSTGFKPPSGIFLVNLLQVVSHGNRRRRHNSPNTHVNSCLINSVNVFV